ncbi:hypothetical protein Droror1_Dr00011015 [Drosera rotundifolia]
MLPPSSSAVQGGEFTRDEIDCALTLIQLSNTRVDPLEREQLYSLVKKSEDKPTRRPNRNLSDQEKPPKRARIMSSALKPRWVLSPVPEIETLEPALIKECSFPFVKEIKGSDTNKHCRLLLMMTNYYKFLEEKLSREEIKGLPEGLRVTVYDETGVEYEMIFKRRPKMVVLIRGWMRFVSAHGLKKGDSVAVWMFRRKDRKGLCFAIMILKPDDED